MDNHPNGQFNNYNGQDGAQPIAPNFYAPVPPPMHFNSKEFQEKQNNKRILKTMGFAFGLAILIYNLIAQIILPVFLIIVSSFAPNLIKSLLQNPTASWAFDGIVSVFALGGSFLTAHLILKSKKYTGVLPFGTTYNTKASVSLTMFVLPVVFISTFIMNYLTTLVEKILGLEFKSGLEDIASEPTVLGSAVIIVTLAVIPAIVEELCIRGIVMQPLRRFGDGFAIAVSAAIFSLLHGNFRQIPYTFAAGIIFGYVCIATGSIWPSVILHFINNFYSAVQVITESYSGYEATIAITLVMLGIIALVGVAGGIIFFSMKYKTDLKKGVTNITVRQKIGWFLSSSVMIIALVVMCLSAVTKIISD